jgi:hypothetical protein
MQLIRILLDFEGMKEGAVNSTGLFADQYTIETLVPDSFTIKDLKEFFMKNEDTRYAAIHIRPRQIID